MQTERAQALQKRAQEIAATFSQERGGNPGAERFEVERIIALGETTAAVVYKKSSAKKAVCFLYYVNSRAQPRWEYFFVTYAHLASLRRVEELLFEIEQHNYQISIEPPW